MIDHHTIDPENMHKSIFEFPDHIIQALELGNKITLHNNYEIIKNIVVAGMGGSAIGGDLVSLLIKNEFTTDDKYLAVITENGLWIRDEINETTNIITADKINNNLLINVSIVQFDKNFNLLQSIESKEVDVKSKYWIIKNPIINKENATNKL